MGYLLQKSSTTRPLLFLLIASSDHITGLTGASPTVTISKNGGSFATPSGAVTELANGWYAVAANATDTNTCGPLKLHATATSADPCDESFEVVAFNPDDGVRAGLTALPSVAAGSAGGLPVLNSSSGLLQVDLQTIKAQSVTCSAAVTINSVLGSSVALAVDSNGAVTFNNTSIATVATVTNAVTLPTTPPDGYATSANQATILASVQTITTNTARSWIRVPHWFVRPSSGSIAYEIDIYLWSLQGVPEAADSSPTIAARTAAAVSRSDHLDSTTMTLVETGHYKATYTVQSDDTCEAVYFDISWTINGTSMIDGGVTQVQDAEETSTLTAISTTVARIKFDSSDYVKSAPQTEVELTTAEHTAIASDVQTGLSDQGYTTTRAGYLDVLTDIVASIASAVWSATNRTLTAFGFGVTVATNNDKTGYSLISDYDSAKFAASSTELSSGLSAAVSSISTTTTNLVTAAVTHGDSTWATATSVVASNLPSDYLTSAELALLTAAAQGSWYTAPTIPSSLTQQEVRDAMTFSRSSDSTLGSTSVDALLSAIVSSNTTETVVKTVACVDSAGAAVVGAEVFSTSDAAGQSVIAGPFISDASGVASCILPKGDQYLWIDKAGKTFANNGQKVTVS